MPSAHEDLEWARAAVRQMLVRVLHTAVMETEIQAQALGRLAEDLARLLARHV